MIIKKNSYYGIPMSGDYIGSCEDETSKFDLLFGDNDCIVVICSPNIGDMVCMRIADVSALSYDELGAHEYGAPFAIAVKLLCERDEIPHDHLTDDLHRFVLDLMRKESRELARSIHCFSPQTTKGFFC